MMEIRKKIACFSIFSKVIFQKKIGDQIYEHPCTVHYDIDELMIDTVALDP